MSEEPSTVEISTQLAAGACRGPLTKYGWTKVNMVATVCQWAVIIVVITAILIILSKPGESAITINDLRAMAISMICGGAFGAILYGVCYYSTKKHPEYKEP